MMRRIICTGMLFIAFAVNLNVALATDKPAAFFSSEATADIHKAKGLACKTCHLNGKPGSEDVTSDTCIKCHGGYDKLKFLPGVSAMDHNPHNGHFVDLECTNCHKGHEVGENFCDSCHNK